MSFNQIVWKTVKAHYKKYIFYYLCNSFAVMFFLIFSTVYFNPQIVEVKKTESIQYILTVPGVALIVYTILFISYAHSVFIKRRKSEFGLYMTLGMTSRNIAKLLLLENCIIALAALASGIVAGVIFSRLFFLLLMNIVGIRGISFYITGEMFLYTILVFLLVFSVSLGRSLFLILKRNVIDSLKSDKVAESIKMKSPFIGAIGAVSIIGSVLGLYYTYTDPLMGGKYLLLWSILTFIGLYLSIYQFTSFFIDLAKKNKSYYYRRILFLTNLDYKFKKLTSILMLVTVMIFVTILYSTINLSAYMTVEREVAEANPFDIAFLQTENKNNLDNEELYSIFENENPIKEHLIIPIYSYYQKQAYTDSIRVYNFMALDHFNELSSGKMALKDKEFLYVINASPKHTDANEYYQNNVYPFSDESYTLKEIIVENYTNTVSNTGDFIILNEPELEKIKNWLDGFETNVHLMNVANWKESAEVIAVLGDRLKEYNEKTPPVTDIRAEHTPEEVLFEIASKAKSFEGQKDSSGTLFFVTAILSIIFFFGSFILLYLNLFSELEKEKEKYINLKKIGITSKEVKQIISKETTTIFFLPTIIGTALALLYIVAMATDLGGVLERPDILLCFIIISGLYLLIQLGFYIYIKRKLYLHLTLGRNI